MTVEITPPSGQTQRRAVQIKAGQTSAVVDWKPSEAGVTKLKVREAQDRVLDGADAILVKPAAATSSPASAPATTDPAPKPKPKGKVKSKHGHTVKGTPPAGPSGSLQLPSRWRVALTQSTTGAVAASPPDAAGRHGSIDMQVSARDVGGVFADGNEAAKIDVFYVTPDGADAPTDIRVWFHWEGGEVSPQPLIIKKGESSAEARWTSRAVLGGSLTVAGVSPQHPVKPGAFPAKVRFVRPVQTFKVDVPPTISVIEIGELTAHFEDVDGHVVNPGFMQKLSFTPGSALISVDPTDPKLEPDAVQVRAELTPKAFSGTATIKASALGFEPQVRSVRITWAAVLAWCIVGGVLGGFLRFLRSRGTLWKRLAVGLVVGTLGALVSVDGLLTTKAVVLLHNLIAVPITALFAGWLGLSLLDRLEALSALTGKSSGA